MDAVQRHTRLRLLTFERLQGGRLRAGRERQAAGRLLHRWLALETPRRTTRPQRLAGQTASRPWAQAAPPATPTPGPPAPEGPEGRRLAQRAVDPATRGPADSKALRCKPQPLRRPARAAGSGLELPKARTSGPPTRRTDHRHVAHKGLAACKKRPVERSERWCSWTKRAPCCSRILQSSTRSRAFGVGPSTWIWRTSCRGTSPILAVPSVARWPTRRANNVFYNRSSIVPRSDRDNVFPHSRINK